VADSNERPKRIRRRPIRYEAEMWKRIENIYIYVEMEKACGTLNSRNNHVFVIVFYQNQSTYFLILYLIIHFFASLWFYAVFLISQ
jgi:hypothetical protein